MAEDKGDYGGGYKKTLVSDTATERVYSVKINEFHEVDSNSTETLDKKTQVFHSEGEWFANRVWKFSETRFPPKTRYLTNDEVQHLLDGKK